MLRSDDPRLMANETHALRHVTVVRQQGIVVVEDVEEKRKL
jgi:hypothetical protein